MGILSRIGKPGEKVSLLAFHDNFNSFELKDGWTKYAQYVDNSKIMEGAELNDATPLIMKKEGKNKGLYYPVDFDKGHGITFDKPMEAPEKSFIETRDDGKQFLVEYYPGIPVMGKKRGNVEGFIRVLKFDISPVQAKIRTNPKLIGHATAAEILANSIRLKPMRWQLIAVAVVMFLLGYAF